MNTGIRQNFLCIGAQKAGTTTLADILSHHPDICIPPIKETKFFLFDEDYAKGKQFYDTYFSNWTGQSAVGEIDPDYLLFPFTGKRIAETLGTEIKILVILRNPADRAFSHYLMTKRKGLEPFAFEQAILKEADRKHTIREQKIFAYLERGYYGRQLSEFTRHIPARNFLFLNFENDLIGNRITTLGRIQDFLGVQRVDLPTELHSNEAVEAKSEMVRDIVRRPNVLKRIARSLVPTGLRKSIRKKLISKNSQRAETPKLSAELRAQLISIYYKDDIQLTEQITGLDLKHWY